MLLGGWLDEGPLPHFVLVFQSLVPCTFAVYLFQIDILLDDLLNVRLGDFKFSVLGILPVNGSKERMLFDLEGTLLTRTKSLVRVSIQ